MTPAIDTRDSVNSPDILYPRQETRMQRAKKTKRMNFWVDKEVLEALEALQQHYGPDVTISEIIREAIIEKAFLDAKHRKKPNKKAG